MYVCMYVCINECVCLYLCMKIIEHSNYGSLDEVQDEFKYICMYSMYVCMYGRYLMLNVLTITIV